MIEHNESPIPDDADETLIKQRDIEMLSPDNLRQNVMIFWHKIQDLAARLNLNIEHLYADHLALRVNDLTVAKTIHQQWKAQGQQISNAQINGRPIIVIKLERSIDLQTHQVHCLELPYPGNKTYPEQGWEHVEFVVPCAAASMGQVTLDELKAAIFDLSPSLAKNWHYLESQGIHVKVSSPQGENERLANPTIAFKYQGVCIKLHPHSLEDVIASEQ